MNVYELMEEIINVIGERKYSDEELKEVANKVYDKRAEKFHKEVNKLDKITGDTNPDKFTNVQKHRANKQAEKVERAQDRLQHAEEVAQLSKKDALRRFYAADKTNEAFELMEEIINEVSLGKWKEAAKSSLPKRKENAEIADKATEKGWDEYDKNARRYPEEEPALYRLAQANDEASIKAKERAEHAEDVANIGSNDKASANKVIKAAKKVQDKREDAFGRNPSARTLKRSIEANKAAEADPVKSRANEAYELMEEILFELDLENKQSISPNKIKKTKKDENGEKVEVVSVADELFPYEGDAKQQFNQKILAKINDMIEGTGSLEDLIQFVRRGVGNKKVAHEGLDEAIAVLEEILNPNEPKKERKNNKQQVYRRMDDPEKGKIGVKKNYNRVIHNDSANKDSAFDYVKIKGTKYRVDKYGEIGAPIREAKDAKGYKENMDIANHYDHLYSKEPANSPDGSPNPVAAEWKRKYQEYFDKAMKCHYGDENKSKKVSEALSVMNDIVNTILERKNIFGHEEGNRGDLIDDVSQTVTGKTLNQHIENTANKVAKPVKKVEEALELMEQILMETSYERKMELLRKREENADQANVNAFKDLIRGYVVGATPEEKAKAEQDFAKSQAKNLEAQGKLNKARRLVQNSGKKKVNEALDLMEDIFSTINKSIHNPSKRKELTDKVKEIQGDRLASEKDVVKRGGKAATRKENGETIYTTDAPDYDRDRPKSKEKEELEVSKSHGIVPTNKERRHAEYEQAVKDADSIHRSMSKHYKKHEVDSDTRGKNWDKSIEYIEKDWKDRKEKLGN